MTSARRLQEDYRRILGITEDTGGLDDSLPRMRIEGQRGIFQIGAGDTKTGAASGSSATDPITGQPVPLEPVEPDEDETNENEDGSGQGGVNTDSPATDGEDFQTDPDNPPPNTDTSSDAFGGNWASGGPSTFVDCEDGTCIEVVEVGGYVPPDGWGDADNGPSDPTWQSGAFYNGVVDAGVIYGRTASEVFDQYPESWPSAPGSIKTDFILTEPLSYIGPIAGRVRYFDINGNLEVQPAIGRFNCTESSPLATGCTIVDPPTQEFWPPDNCIQLAPNADGNFAASNRENPNDMTAKYSEPKSQLDLCTPSGENVQIFKGRDGGNVRWNVNQQRWAASGPDGKYRRFGGASSVQEQLAPNAGTPKAPPP